MSLHGKNFIGSELSAEGQTLIYGFDPSLGVSLPQAFHEATPQEVDRAFSLAAEAFGEFRRQPAAKIADLLTTIASEIEADGEAIVNQAVLESGLTKDRLTGERTRTVNQLRMFAALVSDGNYLDARIDTALPDRKPLPRPDLRRYLIPLGPVAVFGASNFPLAFSVAGGDTASALAARCPVVVKAHPAHPGTCEIVAAAIRRAIRKVDLSSGIFSLLHAADPAVSILLVKDPEARAVAFTGSERAGRAIFNEASRRPVPIPAYVEMGSNNPVFILPGALESSAESIAHGLFGSINLGVGQFCTSPGVILAANAPSLPAFSQKLAALFSNGAPGTMLHPSILKSYRENVDRRSQTAGLQTVRSSTAADNAKTEGSPVLFETSISHWLKEDSLADEIFGPSAVLVRAKTVDDLLTAARLWRGSLTASLFGSPEDLLAHRDLIEVLQTKVGRLLFNGFPTGVEVSAAMHHGGPYPATADPKYTSVGTASILRFLRPICFQNFPDSSLPPELQNNNPRHLWRTINGVITTDPVTQS